MTFRSPIFELSSTYIDDMAKLSPMGCTYLGIKGHDHELDDFSVDGRKPSADLVAKTLKKLEDLQPLDEIDRIAKAVMQERLTSSKELHETYEEHTMWNVLLSPVHSVRQIFEMMAHETSEDFAIMTERMSKVEWAQNTWFSCIMDMAKMGKVTARRQVLGLINTLETIGKGGYSNFAMKVDSANKYPQLHENAKKSDAAASALAIRVKSDYLPLARSEDAFGEERYRMWARFFTGAQLDLRATYEWGLEDLQNINDRMWRIAPKLKPGAKTLREVADFLDTSPDHTVKGNDEILNRLKAFTAAAADRLDGVHFDIDDRIRFCDVRLAPEGSASAAYYMSPSEDLSRPGTTWLPTLGKDIHGWWNLVSTWYHEAIPGHHLQNAVAILEKDRLSRFQRTEAWISGYGEGWALYAERFMDELGAFDEPGIEMGFLSGQGLRAARIVVDIGMHCGYKDKNGNVWNAESAKALLMNYALLDKEHATSEVDRYLGWPGQAISYKVGERVWMKSREDAKVRLGSKFDMKKFHSYALKLGPMGLDPFAVEMSNWDGN